MKRSSGILFPVFSLPGKYGIGSFSKEAYSFADKLHACGQHYWQILPLGPTSYGDSPYQSFSTFAGNPYFIDLDTLVKQKLLKKKEVEAVDFGDSLTEINYEKLYKGRFPLLRKAYERSRIAESEKFAAFMKKNAHWIYDYALFMALKDFFEGVSFTEWPEDIRKRYGYSLDYYREKLYFDIEFYEFIQFEFDSQWKALKEYANGKGIDFIGDIPIYVAADSADVWAHPDLFQMDETGTLTAVAGCPPDAFSADGQLWGNPLYRWDHHAETGYEWWMSRIEKCRELYDVIRIDHFRGFDEYYTVPTGDENARNGKWVKGPGMDLFNTLEKRFSGTKIVAEDLGFMTDTVRKLVRDSGYPNMKVLEFAFDAREPDCDHLPYRYNPNCVVYTGTHDNETLMGWIKGLKPSDRRMILNYIGIADVDDSELADALMRLAHASVSDICIIPMQDYLKLDDSARINTPSTLGCNWKWRMDPALLTKEVEKQILTLTRTYGRYNDN